MKTLAGNIIPKDITSSYTRKCEGKCPLHHRHVREEHYPSTSQEAETVEVEKLFRSNTIEGISVFH